MDASENVTPSQLQVDEGTPRFGRVAAQKEEGAAPLHAIHVFGLLVSGLVIYTAFGGRL